MLSKRITKILGAAAFLLIVFAALGPAKWQVRTGLGWQFDHFAGYFAFTLMSCFASRRPLVVGPALLGFAVLLEALQALTPDRFPDVHAALYSAAGVLTAALTAELFVRAPRRLNGRMLLIAELLRSRLPSPNDAGAGVLTASPRGSVGSVTRGVVAQSPALAGLVSQQSG